MRTRDLLVICVNQNQVAFHSILAVGSEKASHTRIHISAFVVAYHVLHILGCHSCNFSKNQKIKKRRLRASTGQSGTRAKCENLGVSGINGQFIQF